MRHDWSIITKPYSSRAPWVFQNELQLQQLTSSWLNCPGGQETTTAYRPKFMDLMKINSFPIVHHCRSDMTFIYDRINSQFISALTLNYCHLNWAALSSMTCKYDQSFPPACLWNFINLYNRIGRRFPCKRHIGAHWAKKELDNWLHKRRSKWR